MLKLKALIDSLEGIPEHFHELYTKNAVGKYELTGVEGIKSQADIDRLKNSLEAEKKEHKTTKEQLDKYLSISDEPEELQKKVDRIQELEAAAADKIPEAKIQEMVEARIKSRTAPLERQIEKLTKDVTEKDTVITDFKTKETTRVIHDNVRKAALSSKIVDTAVDDVLMLAERVFTVSEDGKVITKENVGITPGVDPVVWLTDMQKTRSHWWPPSQGGGAAGSGSGSMFANNPFAADSWNLTKQGELLRTDRNRAEQMAKAAGTNIGGPRPAPAKK